MPDRRYEFEITINDANGLGTAQSRQIQVNPADRRPPIKPRNAGAYRRRQ